MINPALYLGSSLCHIMCGGYQFSSISCLGVWQSSPLLKLQLAVPDSYLVKCSYSGCYGLK